MKLRTLSIEHFRSYDSLTLDLSGGDVHVLLGQNGAGKTNVLEAISILSLTRSSLGAAEQDLLRWEQDFYRLRAAVQGDAGDDVQLEVVSQQQPKREKACFRNDVRISVDSMVGLLPTVLFLPQTLDLFSGAPTLRRTFLDQLLCQVSPQYLQSLVQYQRTLKQRNALLKRIAEGSARQDDLSVWDEHLIEHGVPVTLARLELIGTLQLTLPEEVRTLGEATWNDVALVYERKTQAQDSAAIAQEYRAALREARPRDCALQSTMVGPHRDDWYLSVDGRPLQNFASRGQQRTALLALLLLQVSYLELRCGEKPVILLDDVFSELDDRHQNALLSSLAPYQVIITATHVPPALGKALLWDVGEGTVTCRTKRRTSVAS